MTPFIRPPFAVRIRLGKKRHVVAALAMCALVFSAGCRHGRSAMRPVFGRPTILRPAAPCPSGDCGTMIPATDPGFSDPNRVTPVPETRIDSITPTPPSNGDDALRSGEPNTIGNEPILEPNTPGIDPSDSGDSGTESRFRPSLEPPAKTSTRPTSRGRATTKQAVLRQNVQAYVNDPADLFTPPRADRAWRYIVLHHSAHPTGSFAQIDRDHRERLGTAGCGYHFVVGNGSDSPDGQVEVATRWSEQKAGQHCRDSRLPEINEYGIGICLVGDFDASAPSDRQAAATRALVAYLQARYDIPSDRIITHDRAARTATSCPGRNFSAQAVLGESKGLAMR